MKGVGGGCVGGESRMSRGGGGTQRALAKKPYVPFFCEAADWTEVVVELRIGLLGGWGR
jgi:hypothetical protein